MCQGGRDFCSVSQSAIDCDQGTGTKDYVCVFKLAQTTPASGPGLPHAHALQACCSKPAYHGPDRSFHWASTHQSTHTVITDDFALSQMTRRGQVVYLGSTTRIAVQNVCLRKRASSMHLNAAGFAHMQFTGLGVRRMNGTVLHLAHRHVASQHSVHYLKSTRATTKSRFSITTTYGTNVFIAEAKYAHSAAGGLYQPHSSNMLSSLS